MAPLAQTKQRHRIVSTNSHVFRIQIQRRPILYERATQIAVLLQAGALIVQLHRLQGVLGGLLFRAQQFAQLPSGFSGLFRLALLAKRDLQVIQRGLVSRVQTHGLLQVLRRLMRFTLVEVFGTEAGLRHRVFGT